MWTKMRARSGVCSCLLVAAWFSACLSAKQPKELETPLPLAIQTGWQFEDAILQQATDSIAASAPVLEDRSMYSQRLAMVSKVLRSSGSTEFIAIGTSQVDAFSLPDGRVFVSRSMLDLLDDDELTTVLALEAGHLRLGTSKARVQSAIASAVGDGAGVLTPEQQQEVVAAFSRAQFDATQVAEAEKLADQILRRAGRSVAARKSANAKLAALGATHAWVRAHPSLFPDLAAQGVEASGDRLADALGEATPSMRTAEAKTGSATAKVEREIKTATLSSKRSNQVAPLQVKPPTEVMPPSPIGKSTSTETSQEIIEQIPDQDSLTQDVPLSAGWYVQVAAEESAASATSKQQSLRQMGHIVVQQAVAVQGQQFYRVLIGPFSSRSAAEQTRQGVLNVSEARGTPFLKRIK